MTLPVCEVCAAENEWEPTGGNGTGVWVPRRTPATHAAPVVKRVWEDSYPSDVASAVTFLCEGHVDMAPKGDDGKPVVSRLDQSDKAPRVLEAIECGRAAAPDELTTASHR